MIMDFHAPSTIDELSSLLSNSSEKKHLLAGATVQGIGWALNEECIYGKDGRLQNPGFLDYRVPVASDASFLDVEIVEVPNPYHPYGVRGIGEVPIIPPTAAIANAINDAIGVRFETLPLSPPKVLSAIIGNKLPS
tara:strand:+ start:12106 stop:12513 length:408 start_codon:yes stop_codon:yes gene_type:complete